ncbi:hypothetical protein [Chitinophaga ginsengisegetis]|uniref:hypothetical protein n=1 Tax=Chitinophaga ginsengisegetis TaxID=393003 RepID=UPI000DB95BF6|nr:hypothetical protein [Chitinophaga ginsengisegetis]MDR6565483.1 hypothetical protein [Chitinophaga ginsengisegetis]MDR6645211.1 hypothetical protein [Chitinophaga ginsengisegetis]MDR6652197.1 hypothetical protein [Chitinophaga ginsengisegetis]
MEDIGIDIFEFDPMADWTVEKKNMFAKLEVWTFRILQKGKDITSNLGEDFFVIYMTYGLFADKAHEIFHKVCSLAKDYDFNVCEDKFLWAQENSKYKTLSRLSKILKYYEIDTSYDDEAIEDAEAISVYLPAGVDPNFALEHGFYPYVNKGKTGYYFRASEKNFTQQSNFVITPLVHIMSKSDNKRIIRIDNGFKSAVLDLPSRFLISLEQFSGAVVEEGNFLFYGVKQHLMRIMNTIMSEFPTSYELKTLGWQPEGFFAWSNAIYRPGYPHIEPFDEVGIAEVDGTNYFSPSVSSIYSGQRADDDEYENDRYLKFTDSDLTFEKWADLLYKVYPDHAMMGISFVLIGLLKEVVFKIDNNCPLLSAYGQKGSGKSKFAESISAVFLTDLLPFNLFHGTDYAFFNRISRFRNCVTWLDEFDDALIKDDRFQSIKGAYDGAGRERGKGGSRNKTEVAKINSALLLTGQYLSTKDDNAALTRCIILPFIPNNTRTKDQISAYEQLKAREKKGLSSVLLDLLKHRAEFEKEYVRTFPETFSSLREQIIKRSGIYLERVLRNYSAAMNCLKLLSNKFTLPFTLEEAAETCISDIIRFSTLISESDSLADFWNTVSYLLDIGEISEGFHFRIHHADSIKVLAGDGATEKKLPGITKILLLRITTIHKLYLEAFRKQTGKTGINLQSLELYLNSAKGYIGKCNSQRFTDLSGKGIVTSCYAFVYDELGVSLERELPEAAEQDHSEVRGFLVGNVEHVNISGKNIMRYKVFTAQTYKEGGKMVRHETETYISDLKPTNEEIVLSRQMLLIKGVLKVKVWTDKEGHKHEKRSMEAHSVTLLDDKPTSPEPVPEDVPF